MMGLPELGLEWGGALDDAFSDTCSGDCEDIEDVSVYLLSQLQKLFVWLEVDFPEPQTIFSQRVKFSHESGGKVSFTPAVSILTKEGIEFSLGERQLLEYNKDQEYVTVDPNRVVIRNLELTGWDKDENICCQRTLTLSLTGKEDFTIEAIKTSIQYLVFLLVYDLLINGASEAEGG